MVEFADDSDWSISENEEEDETLHITARYRIYDEEWNAWVVKKVITGLDSTERHTIVRLILHDHQDQTAGDPDTKVWAYYSGLVEANHWARCHLDLCNNGDHKWKEFEFEMQLDATGQINAVGSEDQWYEVFIEKKILNRRKT